MNCRGCNEGIVHNWHYDYPETYNEWKERTMGDEIELTDLQIVEDDLLQFDIRNTKTRTGYRMFVRGQKFFKMLGEAMNSSSNEHMHLINDFHLALLAQMKKGEQS